MDYDPETYNPDDTDSESNPMRLIGGLILSALGGVATGFGIWAAITYEWFALTLAYTFAITLPLVLAALMIRAQCPDVWKEWKGKFHASDR